MFSSQTWFNCKYFNIFKLKLDSHKDVVIERECKLLNIWFMSV
jgi:hypothetical protein